MNRHVSRWALAVSTIVAAPWVGPARADDSPKGVDACSLLTKADAEKMLGKPVKDAEHPLDGAAVYTITSCNYRAVSGGERVSVMVIAASDAQSARSAFDLEKKQAPSMMQVDPQDVAGIGDAAFWEGGSYNKLRIVKGRIGLTVGVSTETKPEGKILELAKQALSRLP